MRNFMTGNVERDLAFFANILKQNGFDTDISQEDGQFILKAELSENEVKKARTLISRVTAPEIISYGFQSCPEFCSKKHSTVRVTIGYSESGNNSPFAKNVIVGEHIQDTGWQLEIPLSDVRDEAKYNLTCLQILRYCEVDKLCSIEKGVFNRMRQSQDTNNVFLNLSSVELYAVSRIDSDLTQEYTDVPVLIDFASLCETYSAAKESFERTYTPVVFKERLQTYYVAIEKSNLIIQNLLGEMSTFAGTTAMKQEINRLLYEAIRHAASSGNKMTPPSGFEGIHCKEGILEQMINYLQHQSNKPVRINVVFRGTEKEPFPNAASICLNAFPSNMCRFNFCFGSNPFEQLTALSAPVVYWPRELLSEDTSQLANLGENREGLKELRQIPVAFLFKEQSFSPEIICPTKVLEANGLIELVGESHKQGQHL